MSQQENLITETASLITRDFQLDETDHLPEPTPSSYEELKRQLSKVVQYLIDTNVEDLYNILYRIDVDETRAKRVLADNPPAKAPELLADMILKREMQKAKTRLEYRKESPNKDSSSDEEAERL